MALNLKLYLPSREFSKLTFMFLWQRLRMLVQRVVYKDRVVKRHPYFMGKLDHITPDELFLRLINVDFQPNYFSFADEGELYNLRRLVIFDSRLYQEHVRIFPDEVRGHFEIAYDTSLGDVAEYLSGKTIEPIMGVTLAVIEDTLEPGDPFEKMESTPAKVDAEVRAEWLMDENDENDADN